MEFECDNDEDGFNTIKLEPDVEEYEVDNSGGSHSKISPPSTLSAISSYEYQDSATESGLDGQNQVVCVWDSVDEAEMDSSHLWTNKHFQIASANDEGGAEQHQQMRNASLKPQKNTRLWPIGKRNGKKWTRLYSHQRAVRQHKCTKCAETFLHKRSLHRHVTIVHGPKVYFWCKRCCHFYNRRDNLRTHYRSHHPMYIDDVDNIQGVGRESLISSGLPLPSSPPVSSSNNPTSSNIKFGIQSSKPQATQLMEREHGAVGARQENLRMRSVLVHKEKDKMSSKSAPQSSVSGKPNGQRATPEKQRSSLSVPLLDISQQARRPSANASSSAATASRGNAITVADVLTYRLQRESNQQAEGEIVDISEDSSSDEGPDPPHRSPVGPRDKGMVRLEHGAPFKDLQVEKVMQGQVTRVSQEHQTFIYSGGEKIASETRKRVYNVLYLDAVGEGKLHTTQATTSTSSNTMSAEQLEKNIQGRVTKVMETSSKYTYSAGNKVTKEKTSRVYDVMLLGGLTNI